jgi:hypothetical protein
LEILISGSRVGKRLQLTCFCQHLHESDGTMQIRPSVQVEGSNQVQSF